MVKNKDIRQAVEAELEFYSLGNPADIMVVDMGCDIALNGTAPCHPQYLAAPAARQRVDGFTKVHNHLEPPEVLGRAKPVVRQAPSWVDLTVMRYD